MIYELKTTGTGNAKNHDDKAIGIANFSKIVFTNTIQCSFMQLKGIKAPLASFNQ